MATGCVTDGTFQNLEVNGTQFGGKKNVIVLIDDRTLTADESGSVVFLNHPEKLITLPSAEAGLHFRVVLGIDATTSGLGCTVLAKAGDCFFGQVRVISTGADNTEIQDVDYATAVGTVGDFDNYDFGAGTATLGGASGDFVDFVAIDDIAWLASATLTLIGDGNPGTIAVINAG